MYFAVWSSATCIYFGPPDRTGCDLMLQSEESASIKHQAIKAAANASRVRESLLNRSHWLSLRRLLYLLVRSFYGGVFNLFPLCAI